MFTFTHEDLPFLLISTPDPLGDSDHYYCYREVEIEHFKQSKKKRSQKKNTVFYILLFVTLFYRNQEAAGCETVKL